MGLLKLMAFQYYFKREFKKKCKILTILNYLTITGENFMIKMIFNRKMIYLHSKYTQETKINII